MYVVNTFSAASIIFRQSDPRQLFVEMKDEGYPNPVFRNHIFLLGGAWEETDTGPRETLMRELQEELIAPSDDEAMRAILKTMETVAVPYRDYIYTVPREVFTQLAADLNKNTWTELASFWLIALPEEPWNELERLQKIHGNLSSESNTRLISLSELIQPQIKISWEMAIALRNFFLEQGIEEAQNIKTMPGVLMEDMGRPKTTYREYKKDFMIQ